MPPPSPDSPIAETERLLLRPFMLADLDAMAAILGNPEVMRFSLRGPYSREETAAFLDRVIGHYADRGAGLYAVIGNASKAVLGYCGYYFQEIDDREEWEIGYRLDPAFWGRGLATEAACAVRDYGFATLRRRRFISIIEAENTASIRVAEKMGMQHEKDSVFKGIRVRIYALERIEAR